MRHAFPILLATALVPAVASAGELSVRVEHVRSDQGAIFAALYDDAVGFVKHERPRAGFKVKATQGGVSYVFHNLPAGKYALAVFHDENGNGRLDKSFLGIPKEGYGFSNSNGSVGVPAFDQAVFDFDGTKQSITIVLRY